MASCSREDAKRVSPVAGSPAVAAVAAPPAAGAAPPAAALFAASGAGGMTSPPSVSASGISARSFADIKPVVVDPIYEFVREKHRGAAVTLGVPAAPVDGMAWAGGSPAGVRPHGHMSLGGRSVKDLAPRGGASSAAMAMSPLMASPLAAVKTYGSPLLQAPAGGFDAVRETCRTPQPFGGLGLPLPVPSSLGHQFPSPAMGSSTYVTAAAPPSSASAVRPRCVPPPPFALTPHIIDVELPLTALRGTLEQALRDANVDYEYSDVKWKAKCYAYRTRGQCQFVLRIFAAFPLPPAAPAGSSPAAHPQPVRESFLLELQKRRGCCNTFRQSLDRLIARFGCLQLLPSDCPAAARLRALYAASAAVPWGLLPRIDSAGAPGVDASPASPDAASAGVVAGGGDAAAGSFPPPPLPAGVLALLEAKRDVASLLRRAASAGAFDGSGSPAAAESAALSGAPVWPSLLSPEHAAAVAGAVDGGVDALEAHGELASVAAGGSEADDEAIEDRGFGADGAPSATAAPSASPRAAAAPDAASPSAAGVVSALAALAEGIVSEYEDVCTPAAQALSLLSASRRVRCAVGDACAAFNAASRGAASPAAADASPSSSPAAGAGSLGSPCAGAVAAGPIPLDAAQLAVRLVGTLLLKAADPNSSPEFRTACALALANFARSRGVADALMSFKAPQVLLDAAAAVHVCARAACLRRQLLRAAWHVISTSSAHARLALRLDCLRRAGILASSPRHTGLEPGFDALIRRIAGRLSHEHAAETASAAAAAVAAGSPAVHVVASAGAASLASSAGADGSSSVLVGSSAIAGALGSGASPAPAATCGDAEQRD